jgi:prefoldin subunit 5
MTTVLEELQRQYEVTENEIKSLQRKIERLEERLAELAEVIGFVSQLPRYQKEKEPQENEPTDSVPQKDGVGNGNKNSVD